MTILEKKSERKKKALINLVEKGEYSVAFALMEAERLNDEGKLLDNDYEEVAEYLEGLLEPVDTTAEDTAENAENTAESEEQ